MTTSAQVRTAWKTNIWEYSSIVAITPKTYQHELNLSSQHAIVKIRHQQEINYITAPVARSIQPRIMGSHQQTFTVPITAYRQADRDREERNYNNLLALFEAIDDRVIAGLNTDWDSTVDYYEAQTTPPTIELITLDEMPVWKASFTYTAFKIL